MFGICVFSDLQFHAETVNKQLNEWLVFDLEFLAFVQHFLYEDFKLDTGTVFRVYELFDDIVELIVTFV